MGYRITTKRKDRLIGFVELYRDVAYDESDKWKYSFVLSVFKDERNDENEITNLILLDSVDFDSVSRAIKHMNTVMKTARVMETSGGFAYSYVDLEGLVNLCDDDIRKKFKTYGEMYQWMNESQEKISINDFIENDEAF